MDNPTDIQYIQTRSGKQAIVDTHVEGITEYLSSLKPSTQLHSPSWPAPTGHLNTSDHRPLSPGPNRGSPNNKPHAATKTTWGLHLIIKQAVKLTDLIIITAKSPT